MMNYYCEQCDKIFTGSMPYSDHINSEKHKIKISMDNISSTSLDITNKTFAKIDKYIIKQGDTFKCVPCKLTLNGQMQAESHSGGKNHSKQVRIYQNFLFKTQDKSPQDKFANHNFTLSKENNSSQPLKNETTVKMAEIPNSSSTGHSFGKYIIQNGDSYKCILCDVTLAGIQLIRNHISGTHHLKKITSENNCRSEAKSENFKKNEVPAVFNNTAVPTDSSNQKSSNVSESGIQTIDSNLINTTLYKLDEYITKYSTINGDAYKCIICNKKLNCALQAQSHVDGVKHLKQIKIFLFDSKLHKSPDSTLSSENDTCRNLNKRKFDDTSSDVLSDMDTSGITNTIPSLSNSPKISDEGFDKFITKTGDAYKCVACNLKLNSIPQTLSHISGRNHAKQVKSLPSSIVNAIESSTLSDDQSDISALNSFLQIDIENIASNVKIIDVDQPIQI